MLIIIILEQRDQISPFFKQMGRPYVKYAVTKLLSWRQQIYPDVIR